ncbi:pentapeptide repeat-containing protein [Microcoleus sp. AT9_A2]|uniref:pentapeptide repeat-containing protein n=1 Tax=Microcoleus sp. AT9_A2 TaxID=2818624 RepID=UPI002FD3A0A4
MSLQEIAKGRIAGADMIQRYRAGERNFTGIDLKYACLGWPCFIDINLSRADLRWASFDVGRTRLINANLSDANMEKVSLGSAFLLNANLRGANLRNAHLTNSDLTNADLTNADLIGANLSGADLIGANLTGANITDIKTTKDTIFCQTIMPNGQVQTDSHRLTDVQEFLRLYEKGEREFRDLVLHEVDLSNVSLSGVKFLGGYCLSHVNLVGAKLTDCNFGGIKRIVFSDLRNTHLINCEWRNSQIIYCDLRGAYLELFDMYAPDFTGSNLEGIQEFFGVEEDMYFCNTTWVTGEFIPGPINSSERWRERPQKIRNDRF